MEIFLRTVLSFPTVLFSFMLCLAVIYWAVVAMGLLEVDLLDFEADSLLDGAHTTEGLAGLLIKFKLNGVPVTLVLTLLMFFSWFLTYFTELYIFSQLPLGWLRYPLGLLLAVLALFWRRPSVRRSVLRCARCFTRWKPPAASRCWGRLP